MTITGTASSGLISGTALLNTAVVTPANGMPTRTNPVTVTVTVIATPTVSVSKIANVQTSQPGGQVVYTIRITSTCAAPTVVGNLVSTTINLGPGATVLLVITTTVRGNVASGVLITNTAFVSPDPLLNIPPVSSPPATTTATLPVLRLVKMANAGTRPQAVVGDIISYTIVVSNVGTGIAYNVVITDPIPAATTYVTGSAQPAATFSNNTLRWTVPMLVPGQMVTFALQLQVGFVGERGVCGGGWEFDSCDRDAIGDGER